jgi:hypothetical protein
MDIDLERRRLAENIRGRKGIFLIECEPIDEQAEVEFQLNRLDSALKARGSSLVGVLEDAIKAKRNPETLDEVYEDARMDELFDIDDKDRDEYGESE